VSEECAGDDVVDKIDLKATGRAVGGTAYIGRRVRGSSSGRGRARLRWGGFDQWSGQGTAFEPLKAAVDKF